MTRHKPPKPVTRAKAGAFYQRMADLGLADERMPETVFAAQIPFVRTKDGPVTLTRRTRRANGLGRRGHAKPQAHRVHRADPVRPQDAEGFAEVVEAVE